MTHRVVHHRIVAVLASIAAFLLPLSAIAGNYELSVTRKGKNLYKVDGKNVLIHTRYCYEYTYGSDALLRMDGRTGKLHFLEEDESCDVKAVYGRSEPKAGKFQVTINHEDDDWYEIAPDVFVQTSLCLELALGEDGILEIRPGGFGKLHFLDSENSCTVEGVFEKLSL